MDGDEDVEPLLGVGHDAGDEGTQVDDPADVVAVGHVDDQQTLIRARTRGWILREEVDVEGKADAVLDDDAQRADHVRMVGGAVVDVVVVDLHAPAVAGMVVEVVGVRRLCEREHRNGEDHQEHQPPT